MTDDMDKATVLFSPRKYIKGKDKGRAVEG
jgi:hypothetical protein